MKLIFASCLIALLLVCMGCTPQDSQQVETHAELIAVQEISPATSVALTIIYDESENLPTADEITILINNEIHESEADGNIFKFHLPPGDYDIQISSVNRTAARSRLTVSENTGLEQTFYLKSEAWGLLGDYDIRLIGLSENHMLDIDRGLQFGVFDEARGLLPFDHISIIIVRQIEAGSFTENVGGYGVARSKLIQDMFSIKGLTGKMSTEADAAQLLQSLAPGDYDIEIDIFDSVNDKSYHDVSLFRVPPKQQP